MKNNEKSKKNRKRINGLTVIPIVLGIFLLTYIIGIFVFWNRIMPNSYVGDVDISYYTEQEIDEGLQSVYGQDITVELSEYNPKTFALLQIKEDIDDDDRAKMAIEEQRSNILLWPVLCFKHKDIPININVKISTEKLKNMISAWNQLEEPVYCQDAYIALNEETNDFYIEPEKYGNQIDEKALTTLILTKLQNKEYTVLSEEIPYIEPSVKQNDKRLSAHLEEMQNIINQRLTIDMVGASEEIKMKDIIDLQEYLQTENINIDEGKIEEFVTFLADKYDTYGTQRKFKTHDGRWIQVGGQYDGASDTYGFSLDWESTKDEILSALETGEDNVTAIWDTSANTRDENGDIGDTYIEISLDEQHLWYWVDGELFLDTPIVTGMPTASRHTPTGVFGIFSKGTDITLRGSMDGESWNSFVNYWMSVTWTEVGIHDAPWRGTDPSNYGGNIYTYNGSHGCINLPYAAEESLYYNTDIGTCVVIY